MFLAVLAALLLTIPAAASAAPSTLWQRCDGGEDDISCGNLLPGVATAPATAPVPGEVFVTDQVGRSVDEFTPWGEFVKTWGWDVVAAGPGDKGTGFEVCVPANGDVCKPGVGGTGAGQLSSAGGGQGVAVDSAGNVYVVDKGSFRVQKFSPAGEFLRMWGKGVNSGTSGNPDLCTNAGPPTDVCGASGEGTANGQFSGWVLGSYIAIFTNATATEADDRVYVGDKGRIQRFNAEGAYQSQITLGATETVQSLAVDTSGNIYAAIDGQNDVRKWSSAGVEQTKVTVPTPRALATDGAKNLYVISGSSKPAIVKFNSSGTQQESWGQEELPAPKLVESTGIAAGSACFKSAGKEAGIYVANNNPGFLRAYGPAPSKTELCPKPKRAPSIAAQYALSVGTEEATLGAQINPRFWADATYRVQYATAACIEGGGWEAACVQQKPSPPGSALGGGETTFPVSTAGVFLNGLTPGAEYRYRFVVQSGGGGPVLGAEKAFRTLASPGESDSCPNAVFRTGPGAALPDCRAYEMVSPIDKAGADIVFPGTSIDRPAVMLQSSTDGDGLAYTAFRAFGDAQSAPISSQYIARRDPGSGWSSEGISPVRGISIGSVGAESEYKAFSADLCEGWLVPGLSTAGPLAPRAAQDVPNLYRREGCGAGAGGYEAWGAGSLASGALPLELQGLSEDGGHAVFRTADHLAQDAAYEVGTRLECKTGTKAKTISFRWLRDGAPIGGANNSEYQASAADEGKTVQCQVTATNENAGATQIANPAWVIAPYPVTEPPQAPQEIPAPSASEALAAGGPGGQTLTCDPGAAGWEGSPSFEYQWYRNGVAIAGASEPTYLVQASDLASAAVFQCEAIGANAGGRVAIVSANLATSPAPSEPPAPLTRARTTSSLISSFTSVYDSGPGGELRTVCVLPGTKMAMGGCSVGTALGSVLDGRSQNVGRGVSEDGATIFWTNSSSGTAPIYARIDGEETIAVSKAGEELSGEGGAMFWTAAADGSKAVFSVGSLGFGVNSRDLYEFDLATQTTTPIAGEVAGVLGASEDATRIYLISAEALAAGATAGAPNLYLYEAGGGGQFTFVARLSSADAAALGSRPTPVRVEPYKRLARVSADGGMLAFVSNAAPTGYDNTDVASGEADAEVFRYEAAGNKLECVSCAPSGARRRGGW